MSAAQLTSLVAAGVLGALLAVLVILLTRLNRVLGDVRQLLGRLAGSGAAAAVEPVGAGARAVGPAGDGAPASGRRPGRHPVAAGVQADGGLADTPPARSAPALSASADQVLPGPATTRLAADGPVRIGVPGSEVVAAEVVAGVATAPAGAGAGAGDRPAVGTELVRADGPSLSEVAAATLGPPLVRAAALGYGIRTVLAERARPRPGRRGLFGTSLGATGAPADRERARRRAARGRR